MQRIEVAADSKEIAKTFYGGRPMSNIHKIVVLGGGSSYTPELLSGFINRNSRLAVEEIVLVDIPQGIQKLEAIGALGFRMFQKHSIDTRLSWTLDIESALSGADFVLNQIRVGGLEGRALDEQIPNRFGLIGQETTGAGGLFLGLRTMPVVIEIAKKMERLCPEATLINFTNPAGMVTQAVQQATNICCIGLCNIPINMKHQLATMLSMPVDRLNFDYVGINHLSFITRVWDDHTDYTEALLKRPAELMESVVANIQQLDNPEAVIAAIGIIPCPYLAYYFYEDHQLIKELQGLKDGKGTRANEVMATEKQLFDLYRDPELTALPEALKKRGGSLYSEAALQIVEAIAHSTGNILTVNVRNGSTIPQLPEDAVIEVNCTVDKNGAVPVGNIALPPQVQGLIQHVKSYESLAVAAALNRDRRLAQQALIAHPLAHDAVKALNVFDALWEAQAKHLGYYC